MPPRDPSQIERYTQTKSKGMEKDISCKCKGKKSRGSNTYIWKNKIENQCYNKRQRKTLHNDKWNNPTRGYHPSRYLCTQKVVTPTYVNKS